MNDIESKIKNVLEYVKRNPGCSSNTLDEEIVNDLVKKGLLKGEDITSSSTPFDRRYEFEGLGITVDGERQLRSFDEKTDAHNWRKSPIVRGFIGLFFTISAFIISYWLGGILVP